MTALVALSRAQRLADDILFPAAANVDSSGQIPASHFGALAEAGLYGLAGPADSGGLDADLDTFCTVVEIMAAGCLATTFVWLQHHSAVRTLAGSSNSALRGRWLEPLCHGRQRAGIALAGARPGPPLLRATAVPGGYRFDGTAPWVTGWGLIDVVLTVARDETGNLVLALLPARASGTLTADQLDLVAVNASRTVELSFTGHLVPDELVCAIVPLTDWLAGDAGGLRVNGSLALGLTARCCALIGPDPGLAGRLTTRLAKCRVALATAAPPELPAARAAASALAYQAAGTLVASAGSRAVLAGGQPQRLARESLFLMVFGSRPAIKQSLTGLLAATPAADPGPG